MAIEKSVLVPLSAEETFALLTEPERLRRWQAITARIELRAGGSYRWTIVPGHTAVGNVIEVEPGKKMVMTWGWEDILNPPPGTSTVTITLDPQETGTLVTLVHEGLTDDQAAGHAVGWEHYLGRLAATAGSDKLVLDEWGGVPSAEDKLAIAEASLAVCQLVLRGLDSTNILLPTPCIEFSVNELVDHLIGSLANLAGMAGGGIAVGSGTPEVRVADLAQKTLETWRKRGLEGSVSFGPRTITAGLAANILSIELFVHAWDLASATGQSFEVTEELVVAVYKLATELITPEIRVDRFNDALGVLPDAKTLDRLVAFTGRPLAVS